MFAYIKKTFIYCVCSATDYVAKSNITSTFKELISFGLFLPNVMNSGLLLVLHNGCSLETSF